jgi:hypothetical protein
MLKKACAGLMLTGAFSQMPARLCAMQGSSSRSPAGRVTGKKHVIRLGGTVVDQSAGAATFELPPNWIDQSTYQYQSPEHTWKITMIFDFSVKEATAQAIVSDRVEESKLVLPGFRQEERGPATMAARTGEIVTFVSLDADVLTRTRVLVVLLAPARALIITGQGPANRWQEFEPVWQRMVSSFRLAV